MVAARLGPRPEGPQYLRTFVVKNPLWMAGPASPVALNWVRFFGHLCTFIGFSAEKLGSFRNLALLGPLPSLDYRSLIYLDLVGF